MMREKKHDQPLSETPEARRSSTKRGQKAFAAESGPMELRDLIAQRAYEIYEQRGRNDGEDMNDWLRAEAEVRSSIMAEKPRPAVAREGARS